MTTTVERKFGPYTRNLQLFEVDKNLCIGYIDLLEDFELCEYFANGIVRKMLAKELPMELTILTAANKGVPLAMLVAEKLRALDYKVEVAVARKENKPFYGRTIESSSKSITNDKAHPLILPEYSTYKLWGKAVYIIDDVYTTGAAVNALEDIVYRGGGETCGVFVGLFEHKIDDRNRPRNVEFVDHLFLYNSNGGII